MIRGRNEYATSDEGDECFIEAFTTPPQLVLCGGGHVSQSIAPLAKTLGFNVFVTDDREEFANKDRFPDASTVVVMKPEEVKDLAHRGERSGRVSYWLQPKSYDTDEFREAWGRIEFSDDLEMR